MKKMISWTLSLFLALVCIPSALAKGPIDFSGYTLEELLEIKADLTEEIASRPGGEKMVLGAGKYTVDVDIPAGIYTFKFVQNGDNDVSRTDYYVYENESMYKYDVDRLWLGDMPREEGYLEGDGETRISIYPGEFLNLRYNGAEIARVGNVSDRNSGYVAPEGTIIPKGNYTIGEEIPAGTYNIYYSGTTTSRVRVFQDANEADGTFNKGKETILDVMNPDGVVTLVEGNILRVEYTQIIMTKSSGFNFG
ncbi:MAG: hypothetical protein IKF99_12200 [Oscillospiraceae bacterium]|nr:hypothetical protein [Oscillospiraceae bacterium]